jgi:hypothetical protein
VIIPLIVGAAFAACALAYVLMPVLTGSPTSGASSARSGGAPGQSPAESGDTGASAIEVLREIEFDRATGKLSETDYGALRATYTARAITELRDVRAGPADVAIAGSLAGSLVGSQLASHVASHAVCPACGARAEPDARYCTNCARYLAAVCPACSGPVSLPAARYCTWCGVALWGE